MYKVGFIGIGKMGGALVRTVLEKDILAPSNIFLCDKIEKKLYPFLQKGVRASSLEEISYKADILIIAVEPKEVKSVLQSLKEKLRPSQLIVSIAAGVTISFISRILGGSIPVIRIMPNAAIQVGEGISAICYSSKIDEEKLNFVKKMFASIGYVVELPEDKFDAVTGLSGSGPAYVYTTIQGLIKGGEMAGLSREISKEFAIQTVFGAAKLAKESKKSIKELISSIVTPRGTTAEGIKVLEESNFIDILAKAILKATKRAKDISIEIESQL